MKKKSCKGGVMAAEKVRNGRWKVSTLLALALAAICPRVALCAEPAGSDSKTPSTGALMHLSFDELLDINVEKVSTASRYEQTVAEAPSSVSIVKKDEIKKFGYRTLADILGGVRGLYVNYDRNYSYLGFRGFSRPGDYNSRVLLLVDGHRINDPVYDQALLGTEFPLDVDLIERVEIIRGPSSAIYGNNAFFGVINVITRDSGDVQNGEAAFATASCETYQGRFSLGQKFENDLKVLMSGTYYTSEGQGSLYYPAFNTPTNRVNRGVANQMDGDWFHNYLLKISYHEFTLEGLFGSREKAVPTASYGTDFNDPRYKTTDKRAYVDLKYEGNLSEETTLTAKTYYDYYSFTGDYPMSGVLNRDEANGHWWGAETEFVRKILDRHTISLGMEYRQLFKIDQQNFDVSPYALYLRDERNNYIAGGYAQAELELLDPLRLTAGARLDYYETFGATANPRAGLVYQPVSQTTLKLLYGTAFRAPNAYELYYTSEGYAPAPRNLDPETIDTYEAVWEQQLSRTLRFSACGFYYAIHNLIDQQTDPGTGEITFKNLNSATARGAEVELEARPGRGFLARASYSGQYVRDEQSGTRLNNSPRHLVKCNLIAPLYRDRLFAGVELQYNGSVKSVSGAKVDDFYVVNLTLFSQKLFKGLEVSGSIYNLFDAAYSNPGSTEHLEEMIPQDGRSFRLKLSYHF